MALFSFLLLLLTVNSALSARVVGFHIIGGSQYINMRHTLEELASRGHEVRTLLTIIIFASALISLFMQQ